MSDSPRGSSFNIVSLLVIIIMAVSLLALALPILGLYRQKARQAQHYTQIRGIHQSMVIWSTTSRSRGQYTGIDYDDKLVLDGPATGFSGDATHPAARYWMLLEANAFTPDYAISPADTAKTPAVPNHVSHKQTYPKITLANYSYSMMSLLGSDNEKAEWKETLSPSAIVLSDRAIGSGRADISSVWTEPGSGQWEGGAAHNDNSVTPQTSHKFKFTKYGDGAVNAWDDLFADDPTADDAFLVHENASMAYSDE